MRRLGWSWLLIAVGGLLVACDDDDDDGPIASETEILSLTYGGTAVVAPGGRCPALTATLEFSGEADPGGAFVATQSHCVDEVNHPGISRDGQFRWSFPNGNAISGTYEAVLTPAADPAVRNIDGDFTIESGEGEFEGATGRAEVIGSFNFQTLAATLSAVAAFTHKTRTWSVFEAPRTAADCPYAGECTPAS